MSGWAVFLPRDARPAVVMLSSAGRAFQEQMMIGQVPGVEDAIREASNVGWEAVVLVMIVVTGLTCFGWVVKQLMQRQMITEERILTEAKDRETRLAARVSSLEDMVRGELLALIKANSESMGRMLSAADAIVRASERMTQTLDRFTSVLDVRPCLLPIAEQRRMIKEIHDAKEE